MSVVTVSWFALKTLNQCSKSSFEVLLYDKKLSEGILRALTEISHNFLHNSESLPLSDEQRKQIKRKKGLLLKLSTKRGKGQKLELVANNKGFIDFLIKTVESSIPELCSENID